MRDNNWRESYTAAVLEVNPGRLEERVKATERAIRVRIASLHGRIFEDEQSAMQDALTALCVLKQECVRPQVTEVDQPRPLK